jgi:hypothetical protein
LTDYDTAAAQESLSKQQKTKTEASKITRVLTNFLCRSAAVFGDIEASEIRVRGLHNIITQEPYQFPYLKKVHLY